MTAYHCIEEMEKRQRLSGQSLLVYGPSLNMVLKGRILAFSKKYDLALGKVEFPDSVNIKDVTLTKGHIEPSQVLYSKRYRNLGYIKSRLLKNVLHAGASELDERRNRFVAATNKISPAWGRPLGMEVCMGYTIKARFESGKSVFGPRSGQYFLMSNSQETEPGHSGSPVFSLNGDLAGIVVEIPEMKGLFKNSKGNTVSVAYFTGPEKIRSLIQKYVLNCKSGDDTSTSLALNRVNRDSEKHNASSQEGEAPVKRM